MIPSEDRVMENDAPRAASADGNVRPPSVSVVVVARRRPALLERCLHALLAQSLPGARTFEILVVDDGRCDITRDLVERIAVRSAGRPAVRYLLPALTRGPAAARNVGWRNAAASVVAFTEDDAIPTPQWLLEGLKAMSGGVVAAWGPLAGPMARPGDDRRPEAAAGEFSSANCFVRRRALERIGGFDERFEHARDGADLHFSIIERRGRVVHAPRAVVARPMPAAPWRTSLHAQSQLFFDALLFRKHPALYARRIRRRAPLVEYGIVLCAIAALLLALARQPLPMAIAGALWLGLTIGFVIGRLPAARRDARHWLAVVATSAVIPFLAVFWRIAGSVRFRTIFV